MSAGMVRNFRAAGLQKLPWCVDKFRGAEKLAAVRANCKGPDPSN